MTAYNHEPYLRQAIESVLAQVTSFGVELVLGEDCSSDATAAICREYAGRYPDRVRLVTSDANVGWRANYRRTFDACRGKYVAYCDGDDWWDDPLKLQTQADLLESDPSCGMCFTRAKNYYQDTDTFTPDEEVGRGVDHFDVKAFGADFAYTVDGGFEGELEYENFNAAGAKIEIQGRNVHPGYAKDKMINAIEVAAELGALLPAWERPEHTDGYEGFYHCVGFNGTVEKCSVSYIVRDHDAGKFEQKKRFLCDCAELMNRKYGEGTVKLTVKDQYFNMRKMVEPHPQVIDKALEAMRMADVVPVVRPIRGGTDGARLSFMGLPCPNLFTGGMNFHGKFEYASLTSMHKAMHVVINLAQLWAK